MEEKVENINTNNINPLQPKNIINQTTINNTNQTNNDLKINTNDTIKNIEQFNLIPDNNSNIINASSNSLAKLRKKQSFLVRKNSGIMLTDEEITIDVTIINLIILY